MFLSKYCSSLRNYKNHETFIVEKMHQNCSFIALSHQQNCHNTKHQATSGFETKPFEKMAVIKFRHFHRGGC